MTIRNTGLRLATIRVNVELDQALKAVALRNGESMATVARQILREGLAQRGVIDRPGLSLIPRPMAGR